MIESAGQLASKLVIQSAVSPSVSESFSPSVSHSAGQLVSRSASQPVSQSQGEGGGECWGSVTQLVGYSSGKVVSIGLPILLSISSGFFRNCQYP